MSIKYIITFFLLVGLFSCDDEDQSVRFFFIGDGEYLYLDSTIEENDYSVLLYQYDVERPTLISGYNNLQLAFYDYKTGKYTTNVSFDMNVFKVNDDTIYAPYYANQTFNNLEVTNSPIYFSEPSDGGEWTVQIFGMLNGRDFFSEMKFDDVDDAFFTRKFEYGGLEYQFTLVEPFFPKVGITNIEFALHKNQGTYWEYVNNFTTRLTISNDDITNPPGVLDPTPIDYQPGHYSGKLNITSSGDWFLKIELFDDENPVYTYEQAIYVKVSS
ncbi:hypothetical protein OAQ99_04285 [Candidatus Kapabacteria bacterium]|nr:hypothetical protein [Candidatus Kapabacteria bacterium]